MPDNDFESRIHRFERAWQRNGPTEIADYLQPPCEATATERRRLLVELIAVDLEFRWQNGSGDPSSSQGATLEVYAARFPELGSLDQWPIMLAALGRSARSCGFLVAIRRTSGPDPG